jgi:hypothetical protein
MFFKGSKKFPGAEQISQELAPMTAIFCGGFLPGDDTAWSSVNP